MAEYVKGDVMNAKNREVEFGKDTEIKCPSCGVQSGSTMKVRSDIDGTAELECPNCSHSMPVPSNSIQVTGRGSSS